MTTKPTALFVAPTIGERASRAAKGTGKFIQTKPLGAMGAFILLFMFVVAVVPGVIAPHDPFRFGLDLTSL